MGRCSRVAGTLRLYGRSTLYTVDFYSSLPESSQSISIYDREIGERKSVFRFLDFSISKARKFTVINFFGEVQRTARENHTHTHTLTAFIRIAHRSRRAQFHTRAHTLRLDGSLLTLRPEDACAFKTRPKQVLRK